MQPKFVGRHAFSYSSPATCNSIPTSIKNYSSLYSFKCHLKSHLIAQLINNTPSGHLPALRFVIHDYMRVINFLLLLLIIVL